MVEIYLDNVTHIYRGEKVPAAKDVTLRIPNGSLSGLLGPSGCGKTTLMRIISGLLRPTQGKVYFDDTDVTMIPPDIRNVAMVFQFIVAYDMSVYDNLAFPLRCRKVPKNETREKVLKTAETLGLTPYLKIHPSKLDAGGRQLVAVGRAIIREPAAFLFDEPLSNLDPAARVKLRTKIKEIQRDLKQTMIFVTHDQAEALTLCEKIALMKSGLILQYDDPENIYNKPRNTFVAYFIGNPGMNFVEGTLEEHYLNFGEFKYDVSEYVSTLKNYGDEFILGVRPEHIQVSKEFIEGYIKAKCSLIESLHVLNLLHLQIGGIELKAKVGRFDINEGEEVYINLPREHVRIFNKKTEDLAIG